MGDFSSFTSSSLRAGGARRPGGQGCDSQRERKERKRSSSACTCPGTLQGGQGREGGWEVGVKILQEGGRAPPLRRPMERKEEKEYFILISAS